MFASAVRRLKTSQRARFLTSLFRTKWVRKSACFAVILNLLLFPVSGAAIRDAGAAAVESVSSVESGIATLWHTAIRSIFKHRKPQVAQVDRSAAVQSLRVAPSHLVAYQNQKVSFSALPTDIAGEVAQGAKITWDTSNHQIAVADEEM